VCTFLVLNDALYYVELSQLLLKMTNKIHHFLHSTINSLFSLTKVGEVSISRSAGRKCCTEQSKEEGQYRTVKSESTVR
jgi:hypothetical protein